MLTPVAVTTGLSNFTSLAALEWPPAWLAWWTAPRDAPVLALLGLVAVMVGLGLLTRARR